MATSSGTIDRTRLWRTFSAKIFGHHFKLLPRAACRIVANYEECVPLLLRRSPHIKESLRGEKNRLLEMSHHFIWNPENGSESLAKVDLHTIDHTIAPDEIVDDLRERALRC